MGGWTRSFVNDEDMFIFCAVIPTADKRRSRLGWHDLVRLGTRNPGWGSLGEQRMDVSGLDQRADVLGQEMW